MGVDVFLSDTQVHDGPVVHSYAQTRSLFKPRIGSVPDVSLHLKKRGRVMMNGLVSFDEA